MASEVQPQPQSYEVQWWQIPGGWKAHCQGTVLHGESRSELTDKLRRRLAVQLLSGELAEGQVAPALPLPGSAPTHVTRITPEPTNPVSLTVRQYVEENGGEERILKICRMSPFSLGRLTDPFYWGHTTTALRRIVTGVGKHLTVTILPAEKEQK